MATTYRLRTNSALVCLFLLSAACGGVATATEHHQKVGGNEGAAPAAGMDTSSATVAGGSGTVGSSLAPDQGSTTAGPRPTEKAYPGSGFVVHEWGTNTVVVGSDGSLQRGLH